MKFCTKCGTKLEEGSSICPNCGYDYLSLKYVKPSDNANSYDAGIKKKILIWSSVAVVLIVSFIIAGKIISNPGRTVLAFENAVNKNNPDALGRVLYTSDIRLSMTSNNVKPLIQSFKETPSEFTDVINSLNNQVSSLKNGGIQSKASSFYVIKSGKTMLFFPKYKISFNPVFLTITSSVKGADILVNGKKEAEADSSSFSKQFGPYIPGIYKIEGKASGAFGEMDNNVKVDFIKNKKQNARVSALKGIYLTVNSDYTNNQVYINGKNTGKYVSSGDKIGPIASGASVYAVINYNGEQVKSSILNLYDNDNSIYFDYSSSGNDPEQRKNDIDDMITGYSSSLASALTYGDTSALVNYMYPGSKIYTQQMNNINSYYKGNNNFYEQYDSAVVNSYKMDPDGKSGVVDATEVYDINEHYSENESQFNTRTFENTYKFKYNDTTNTCQLTERTSAVEK